MQTVPMFIVPPIQREIGGGNATNVIELGAIFEANDLPTPGTLTGRLSLSLARDMRLGL